MSTPPSIPLAKDLRGRGPTLIRQIMNAAPEGTINLGLGQPVIEPAAPLVRAASDAVRIHNAYTPNLGLPALREAIAADVGVDPDHVAITGGAEEALFLAMCGVLEPDDEILVPSLAFPAYPLIAEWRGVTIRQYTLDPLDGFALDPLAIAHALTDRTRLVVLNSPHNPSGAIAGEETLRSLLDVLEERGVPYLSDEVYSTFAFGTDAGELRPSRLSRFGLAVDSFSKRLALMGWRLGWLVAPPDIISGVVPLQQMVLTCAPTPLQHAALAAFTPEGRAEADRIAEELRTRRALALDGLRDLPEVPAPTGDGALYLMLDVSAYLDGDDVALAHRLLNEGVALIPGQAFGDAGRGFLRLSFGATPDEIEEGISRLRRGLAAAPLTSA